MIVFLWLTPQVFIIVPAYASQPPSSALLWLLGPFNALLVTLLYNYYLCVRTDPGGVPREWVSRLLCARAALGELTSTRQAPDPRESEIGAVEVKSTGGPRFCRTCRGALPGRDFGALGDLG